MKGSKLGGPWKVPSLVALEMNLMLKGQWKVPSLVAFGMFHAWLPFDKKKKILFTSFHFSPHKILFKPFFFIDFRVLFYHGYRPLLHVFPSFSLTYKL
jgi:hypothetical protein